MRTTYYTISQNTEVYDIAAKLSFASPWELAFSYLGSGGSVFNAAFRNAVIEAATSRSNAAISCAQAR